MITRHRGFIAAVLAVTVLASAGPALAADYIVESRSGGKNFNKYSETPALANSGAKSTAEACTPIATVGGSRYASTYRSVVGTKRGFFKADLSVAGTYEVFTTWGSGANRRANIRHTVTHRDGSTDVAIDQTASVNTWVSLGRFAFNAGIDAGTVEINNLNNDLSGSFYLDAVKWVLVSADCDVNLAHPTITAPSPLLHTDTTVTVSGLDPNATAVHIYDNFNNVSTLLTSFPLPGAGATPASQDVPVNLSALGGHMVSATQTVGSATSCIDYLGIEVDGCNQVPAVSVQAANSVLLAGDTSVVVTGVDATRAEAVTVWDVTANTQLKTVTFAVPPGPGSTSVTVTGLPAVQDGHVIGATQTIRGLAGCAPTTGLKVGDCAQMAAVRIVGLISEGETAVRVTGVSAGATEVRVYADDVLVGTNNTTVSSPTTVVNVPALVNGQILKATQGSRGLHGCTPGSGVAVKGAGIIEDFETAVAIVQSGVGTAYRTWYDVASNAYTEVLRTGSTGSEVTAPQLAGSNCLDIADHGWGNGAYAKFEQVIPAADPNPAIGNQYHLQVDMLVDERGDLYDKDFIRSYQVGVVVNGAHRPSTGALPAIASPIGNYTGPLTPDQDGYFDNSSQPIRVLTDTFTANAGDDLLIAFSTNCGTWDAGKSAANAKYVGMLIDNIKLVRGPRPCLPSDVKAVSIPGPVEAGATELRVTGVSQNPAATLVSVYKYTHAPDTWTLLGTGDPGGAPEATVFLTEPLVMGDTIVATQTYQPATSSCTTAIEGAKAFTGPVVGAGRNDALRVTLGIRENTSLAGPIGADAGAPGTGQAIEWVGATGSSGGSAPVGKLLTPGAGWQTFTFHAANRGGTDPVLSYSNGNGALDGSFGVLEHLAFTPTTANTGRYKVYIDTVMNGSTLIADFDQLTVDEPAMFREPRASATTGYLLVQPNVSAVDAGVADGAGKSLRVEWQFNSLAAARWVRLTTNDASNTPDMPHQNPQVDLSQPITVRLLLQGCGSPAADSDRDGDVDMDDFGAFQACYNPTGAPASGCFCADLNADNVVNSLDFADFLECATGPNVPFVAAQHPQCPN